MAKKYEVRRRERRESIAAVKRPRDDGRAARAGGKIEIPPPPSGHRAGRAVVVAICVLLALSAVLVFAQTARHEFVNCDDDDYIFQNQFIQRGVNLTMLEWAITQPHSANWHPITWISHALDWQIFGTWSPELDRYVKSWPGGHHLVNLALHALCTVFLFLVLQSMTAATWPSAAVAALFAIHPLHVESVAWATGRKDTLSALLFVLTLAAYHWYTIRAVSWWRDGTLRGFPWGRYALVIAVFGLGLASKPMLVTTPLVLLLLDYWPLRRIPATATVRVVAADFRVLMEKVPLLILSVGSCFRTTWAQASVGAFKPLAFPFRLANASISYAMYLYQLVWPADMVVQYVHKGGSLRFEDTIMPLAILTALTLAAIWFGWRRRYLFVGWFWYVGMLVPVIGLVQVGAQARADRYTYLTQIGLYIMIAWGLNDLTFAWRGASKLYSAIGAPLLAALAAVAWLQTSYWQDSTTLWAHSVACQPGNDFALNSYANALNSQGRIEEANRYYRMSSDANPKYLTPLCNLAANLYKQHKNEEALQVCNEAIGHDPEDAKAHMLRAVALYGSGQVEASIVEFKVAIAKNRNTEDTRSDLADAHGNLAEILRANKHDLDGAYKECAAALDLKPESVDAQRTMGRVLLDKLDPTTAERHFRAALLFRPNDPVSKAGLADSLWRQTKYREAIQEYKQLIAANPQDMTTAVSVVHMLLTDPRPEARFGADAVEIARHACEATEYKNAAVLEVLADAYAETGDFNQAESTIRMAMETPLGQNAQASTILQQRLQLYRAHKKVTAP